MGGVVRGQRSEVFDICRLCDVFQGFTTLLASCSGGFGGAEMFVPRCAPGGAFQPVQCGRGHCWCVDPQGRELAGSRTTGRLLRCPSRCEVQRAEALKVKARLAAGAEVHIPACSAAGDFLPLQCVASRCFCVDSDGKSTLDAPTGETLSCKSRIGGAGFRLKGRVNCVLSACVGSQVLEEKRHNLLQVRESLI